MTESAEPDQTGTKVQSDQAVHSFLSGVPVRTHWLPWRQPT